MGKHPGLDVRDHAGGGDCDGGLAGPRFPSRFAFCHFQIPTAVCHLSDHRSPSRFVLCQAPELTLRCVLCQTFACRLVNVSCPVGILSVLYKSVFRNVHVQKDKQK